MPGAWGGVNNAFYLTALGWTSRFPEAFGADAARAGPGAQGGVGEVRCPGAITQVLVGTRSARR